MSKDSPPPIAEWRKRRGLTQAALAESLRVDVSTITKVEGGSRVPSVPVLAGLCDELGLSVEERVEILAYYAPGRPGSSSTT